jgi:uncharacterized protein YceK
MIFSKITVLLICSFLVTGCASTLLTFRENKDEKNNIYIGTRYNVKTLTFQKETDGMGFVANIIVWPFAVVDLVLCAVADTLYLPYTVAKADNVKNENGAQQ